MPPRTHYWRGEGPPPLPPEPPTQPTGTRPKRFLERLTRLFSRVTLNLQTGPSVPRLKRQF